MPNNPSYQSQTTTEDKANEQETCHVIEASQKSLTICTGFSVFHMAKKKPCGIVDLATSCYFITVFWQCMNMYDMEQQNAFHLLYKHGQSSQTLSQICFKTRDLCFGQQSLSLLVLLLLLLSVLVKDMGYTKGQTCRQALQDRNLTTHTHISQEYTRNIKSYRLTNKRFNIKHCVHIPILTTCVWYKPHDLFYLAIQMRQRTLSIYRHRKQGGQKGWIPPVLNNFLCIHHRTCKQHMYA